MFFFITFFDWIIITSKLYVFITYLKVDYVIPVVSLKILSL